jgi:hypothetical protein
MTLYPEVQKKAQQELDNLFNGRLPEFVDGNAAEALPYIGQILHFSQFVLDKIITIINDYRCYYQGITSLAFGRATMYVLNSTALSFH